ncbi:MAG TPA: hypothetical protein PKH32_12850, partial [Verrucomicrobiota bacterium]|nr:hypothetical protein [Verrucomicrobiota bacterium]
MKWTKALAVASGLAMLTATTATAQLTTQELFHVKFRATCKPGNDAHGKQTRLRDRDLIELCVGGGFSQRDLRRNFALVYNPVSDSIQVADAQTGTILCDVFQFLGGTVVTNNNRLERFTFVFIPTDDTAVGSAVITERTVGLNRGNARARIHGRLQFSIPDGVNWITNHLQNGSMTVLAANVNGTQTATNGTDRTNTTSGDNKDRPVGSFEGPFVQAAAATESVTLENAQVCTGTFTVGRAFEPGVPGPDDNDDLDGVDGNNGDGGDDVVNGGQDNGGETPANGTNG